ncbi:MAG: hypothetical protein H0W09_05150 [Solirubrobacterales bacterium]|nr:hypothetical protein [Solirubrobacterales bacterium]
MTNDIRPLGAGTGATPYWVKSGQYSSIQLVFIDEAGLVTGTGVRRGWDDAAPTKEEALIAHLGPAIDQADAALERFKRDRSKQPKPAALGSASTAGPLRAVR